jgi:hypothetical protein
VLNQDAAPLPEKPAQYSLNKGISRCSGCSVKTEVQADGYDHKVPPADSWDTVNVQIVDTHTLEIVAKRAGKTMLTEVDAISPDGSLLIQMVKDTTEADTVTIETFNRRVQSRTSGSHPISGSWRAYKIKRSSQGSIIQYKCTARGFSGETPLGEKFDAKFDGNYDPVATAPVTRWFPPSY